MSAVVRSDRIIIAAIDATFEVSGFIANGRPDMAKRDRASILSCGVVVDLCSCKLWEPLPDGQFRLLGDADRRAVVALVEPLLESRSAADLLTLEQAARRAGLARKTFYEWKRKGKLRREHGLLMVGRSPRLEWAIFKACIDRGELS